MRLEVFKVLENGTHLAIRKSPGGLRVFLITTADLYQEMRAEFIANALSELRGHFDDLEAA